MATVARPTDDQRQPVPEPGGGGDARPLTPRGPDRRASGTRRDTAAQQLRRIVACLADGVVVVSEGGHIRFVNPAAERLFGRPAPELVGAEFGFPVSQRETTEIEVVRRGGGVVVAELRVVDVDWEGERATLVSLRDVTDRRVAQERARQLERERSARAEAEAANRAKSEFLAVMSHELRTPLNAVLGYADLLDLGLGGALSAEQRKHVSRIRESGRHLLGLVNELLDLARVEAGRLSVEHAPHDAADAMEGALVLAQPLAEAKGLTIRDAVADAATEVRDLHYLGDRDRVRQILANLLSNAVKFTEAGGTITAEVGVAAEPDQGTHLRGAPHWVYFRVSDSGVGIDPTQADAIFAPFVQAEGGHTRRRDGTGLGLAISRRLARLMGGDITLRSERGKGSPFTLWLPGAPSGAGGAAGPADAGAPPPATGLSEVGDTLIRETEAILDAFVAALRLEPSMPAARTLKYSQLADHAAALLGDVASALVALEEAEGAPSALLTDAVAIQNYVADRHGRQRARLGWTREASDREYEILRQEVEHALRRCTTGVGREALQEAIEVVHRFLAEAGAVSGRALERAARGEELEPGD